MNVQTCEAMNSEFFFQADLSKVVFFLKMKSARVAARFLSYPIELWSQTVPRYVKTNAHSYVFTCLWGDLLCWAVFGAFLRRRTQFKCCGLGFFSFCL